MIEGLFLLILGCIIVYEIAKAVGFGKACAALSIAGIMAHELAHAVGCLVFRVKIHQISFLRVEWVGGKFAQLNGDVNCEGPKSAFAAIAITFAPLVGGLLWLLAIACGMSLVQASGADPMYTFLLWVLAFSIASTARPSIPDCSNMMATIWKYPGQFLVALLGMLAGGLAWWYFAPTLTEGWSVVATVAAVLVPGWALSKVYQKGRGQ
nr:hypothetical protein [Candidatus Sigynarchaeota archaeon]